MKTNKMKKTIVRILFICLFSFFLLLISYIGVNAQTIVIVKDHKPNAYIVLPDSLSPQIQKAAKVLQDYIQQSTGALLPISKDIPNTSISIHIGLTDFVRRQKINLKNIDEDGFILEEVNAHNFIIIGGSDWGTEFGVYSFLERYLGVIWLMPTEIGIDIPKHETVTLPDTRIIDSPVFLSRQMSPIDINSNDALGTWGRFNRLRGRINFHHNLLNLLDPKEYYKTNPQFYPQVNGKSEMPSGFKWQPNFSAPGIVDSASAKIIRYFKQNQKITSYSLGINDFSTFDQSSGSLARRNGKRNFLGMEDVSDDYFKWANEVAKKVTSVYPDKLFGLLAYNNVVTPPSAKIGINSHLIPFITYERLKWSDPELQDSGHQLTIGWEKLSSSIGWYDYDYGLDYLVPRVWFHEMQKYLIWGTRHHVKYYYAELYPNWGEGPKPWIISKLLWDPYQNVDSLLNIWYIHMGGSNAATKLKEFYSIWENFWTKIVPDISWFTHSGQYLPYYDRSYIKQVPKDDILQCDSLMNEAYSLADNDIHRQRISKLKQMWQLYKSGIEAYGNNANRSSFTKFTNTLNDLSTDSLFSQSIERIKLEFQIK
jgi:hypothetical protein